MNRYVPANGSLTPQRTCFCFVPGISTSFALILAVCLGIFIAPAPVWAQGSPAIPKEAARTVAPSPPAFASASGILIDGQSGKVLWAKDDLVGRAPASLTKILTALVVLENANPSSRVTITNEARAAHGSRTYAEAGWTFPVSDLLYGLLLQSGNDAAIALAQGVSPDGSVGGFMAMVNRRAAEIGATSTHMMNPHGLDEAGHTTSARDMALISMVALRNPTFAAMVKSQRQQVRWGDGTMRSFRNHNKMLSLYQGTIGVKTGYTNNARHTLVSAVRRNGATLLAVTLGSPKQYVDSIALFDWGFANLAALRAGAHEEIWPPKPPAAQPGNGGAGSNLVTDALRLLDSLGGSSSTPAGVPVPALALSSLFAGSLGAMGFSAVRSRRRFGRQPAPLSVSGAHMPAPAEIPYVSQ